MPKYSLLILLLLTSVQAYNATRVVKVGAFNFYPGIFQDTDGHVKGFFTEALAELGQHENIQFDYVYGSWAEGLERIKTGQVDMLTSVAFTQERATFMDYSSTPLLTVWSEVYTTPSSSIKGILDLEGKDIAIMKDDFNGQHLVELTSKLSINCHFQVAHDFEQVFSWIKKGKVDAGVVNNTFGASKFQQFDLRSTGIVLNPFDIFFTVKKGADPELLKTLNSYLNKWMTDQNSVYNTSRQKWSHGNVGLINIVPKWLWYFFVILSVFITLLLVFVLLLRYRVDVATKKIRRSDAIFKAFMENTPAFVYIKDENLNHLYRNKRVEGILSKTNAESQTSAKVIFEPHIAEMVENADRKVLNNELEALDIQYFCKIQEKHVWLHDYKFYLKLPGERPVIGGISFDITNLKQMETDLVIAKEKAEENDRLKSAFLANMSHEIRTPLNCILGFTDLLSDQDVEFEKRQEYLNLITTSGNNLLEVINDILDISRIESGQVQIKKTNFQLQKIIKELQQQFEGKANNKGIVLKVAPTVFQQEIMLYSDEARLKQILINFVSNALKFTDKGSIEIGLDNGDSTLKIFVTDTGIGITEANHPVIFDRFRQIETSHTRKYGGNGLGLAISKSLIEMLGGTIGVESEVGKGSTFYVELPLKG